MATIARPAARSCRVFGACRLPQRDRALYCYSRQLSSTPSSSKQAAFAFDIDGVLKTGSTVLPAARRAIEILEGNNPLKKKVPYIFITNGGGQSEVKRAESLTKSFKVEVTPYQVVLAHTVLQSLSRRFGDKPILAIGGPEPYRTLCNPARSIMNSYGYSDVYIPADIHAWQQPSWPFRAKEKDPPKDLRVANFAEVPFAAVFVFHDTRDWGRDIQYICDILRSPNGTMGSVGDDTHPQPFLAFSHGDLLWGNDFPAARFGQGAFQTAVRAVYEETSGRKLESVTFGKPQKLTYEYANELLRKRVKGMSGNAEDMSVWMIGDNPASDILGANNFGWNSALVRTGVYRTETGPPAHTPTMLVHDVEEAVRKALSQEWQQEV